MGIGERDIPTQMVGRRSLGGRGSQIRGSGVTVTPVQPKDPHGLVGRVVDDRYQVSRVVAKGAMGMVYEAVQRPFDRRVALKVLTVDREDDSLFKKRFRREASISARLAHPNIVTIYDYGESDSGYVFMAMEFLAGQSLHRLLSEVGFLSVRRALNIAIQLTRALRKAHAQGVVHRDLKPANIIVQPDEDDLDFVKVLDFGLVKLFEPGEGQPKSIHGERLTTVGAMLGTPGYMSPEQAMGEDIDTRTDIYAVGVLLYQMLTGRLPFKAETVAELISMQVMRPVPPIAQVAPGVEVSPELEQLITQCLHRDPARRPEDVTVLMRQLKNIWRFENDESFGTEVSMTSPLVRAQIMPHQDTEPSQVAERASFAQEGVHSISVRPGAGQKALRNARLMALIAAISLILITALAAGTFWQDSSHVSFAGEAEPNGAAVQLPAQNEWKKEAAPTPAQPIVKGEAAAEDSLPAGDALPEEEPVEQPQTAEPVKVAEPVKAAERIKKAAEPASPKGEEGYKDNPY